MNDQGYVNYFEILGMDESCSQGEIRKTYKHRMKDLVMEIARVKITDERRAHYIRELAKLNAAFYILRNNEQRQLYWDLRKELIAVEQEWRDATDPGQADALRRAYDGKLRHFLSRFVEEAMLEAGRDRECVEASNWDADHERHAFRILRQYRQGLYQQLLERLPFYEVTPPKIDWEKRARTVAGILADPGLGAGA